MKKKTKDINKPIGKIKTIKDFLPKAKNLVFKTKKNNKTNKEKLFP